tara:strand:+ start:1140 stop:2213 length:1074 start_codon:yes stop_codon:yes gene_type:complete
MPKDVQPEYTQPTLPGVAEHIKAHPLQPHQMFRFQYEADPRTMWRVEESDELGGYGADDHSGGLHFGDYAAALHRGKNISSSARNALRMFSFRAGGKFSNEPPAGHPASEDLPGTKGVKADRDIGEESWPQYKTGRWYKNRFELGGWDENDPYYDRGPANIPIQNLDKDDPLGFNTPVGDAHAQWTLSGYVPQREGFMTTHPEEVLKAHAAGIDVSPAILHEAQFRPEYSGTILSNTGSTPARWNQVQSHYGLVTKATRDPHPHLKRGQPRTWEDPTPQYDQPQMFVPHNESGSGKGTADSPSTAKYYTPEEYDAAMQELKDKPLKFTATLGDPVPAGAMLKRIIPGTLNELLLGHP